MFALTSGSTLLLFATSILKNSYWELAERFQSYIVVYLLLAGVISFIYCYYKGPVVNPRSLDILNALLKVFSCMLIISGTSYVEVSGSLLIAFLIANPLMNILARTKTFRPLGFITKLK